MDCLGQEYSVRNIKDGVEFWFTVDACNEVPELPHDACRFFIK